MRVVRPRGTDCTEPDIPAGSSRASADGLWDWNLLTNRIHYSPRWISMLGSDEGEIQNTPDDWFGRVHPDDLEQLQIGIRAHTQGDPAQFESRHRMLHQDGTYRWMSCTSTVLRDDRGQAVRITGRHTDITEEVVSDHLTGLPNRHLFLDRVARSIERVKRQEGYLFAVLLLNLDRFKQLPRRLGQAGADQVLTAAARRLETSLRDRDRPPAPESDHIIARLDGDEFAVLLEGLEDFAQASRAARRMLAALSTPLEICNQQVWITASIGIALSGTGYSRPEEALRDADTAMHRAKSLGRARCEVFDTAILDSTTARRQIESGLAGALERREFNLLYQPVVSLDTGQLAGFEALVRWRHPLRGTVSPMEFIPVAEKTGVIVQLGRWILHEACTQLAAWQQDPACCRGTWVSVNVSGAQLRDPGFAEELREELRSHSLDPQCLVLELTENILMENPAAVRSTLMQLRVLGVKVALDDFGSGYSSLSYLGDLPVDILKIDRSFIARMESSSDVAAIVDAICALAHRLGLVIVAEGIETAAQLHAVRALKCQYGQGYFYSQPVDAAAASAWMPATLPAASESLALTRAGPAIHTIPLGPVIEQARPARWSATLLSGLAAITLLAAAGLVVRCDREPGVHVSIPPQALLEITPVLDEGPPPLTSTKTPGDGGPSRRQDDGPGPGPAGTTAEPAKAPTRTESKPPATRRQQTVSSAQPAPSTPEAAPFVAEGPDLPAPVPDLQRAAAHPPAQAAESSIASFEVIHDHVIGSCKGTLRITGRTIAYLPEKGKDGFEFGFEQCTCALLSDNLVIKSGSKTYRFKSATAANPEESRGRLRDIVATVSRHTSTSP